MAHILRTPQLDLDARSADKLQRMFEVAPSLVFSATRFAIERMLREHREKWMGRTQVTFRQRGSKGFKIEKPNSSTTAAGGWDARRTVAYRVYPGKVERGAKNVPSLSKIKGEIYTNSIAALGLEQGGTFRPKTAKYLGIPLGPIRDSLGRVKSRWSTPKRFLRFRKPGDTYTLSKNGGRSLVMFWRQKKGKGQTAQITTQAVWHLVPQVQRQARLRLMDTWDEMGGERSKALADAVEFVVKRLPK